MLLLEPKEIIENEQKPVDSSRPDNENECKQGFGPHMSNSGYSQAVSKGCVHIDGGSTKEGHGSRSLESVSDGPRMQQQQRIPYPNVYCLQIQRTESF